MGKKLCIWTVLALLPLALVWGCGEMGKVEQGRVIAFDAQKGTVTLIHDDNPQQPGNPRYVKLPPMTFAVPTDPNEMGAEPKPGKRMKLDAKAKEITIYDDAAKNFKTINYTLIDQREGIAKDNPMVAEKKFPVVDKEKKAITIYSGRQKLLTTFSVPDEYFALPSDTWEAGDEVRIYFKEPGKALRLMNITQTDIFKK